MLEKTLAFAAFVVCFALIAIPGDNADRPAAEPALAAPSGMDRENAGGWSSGTTTLQRAGDGHFYAATSVNGREVLMLVDTGASVIALTGEDAAAIGLSWDRGSVRPVAEGASGPVNGVPLRLSEVEIGGMVRRNVDAVIVPEGLGVSLLGQSYLSQLGSVSISADAMEVRDR